MRDKQSKPTSIECKTEAIEDNASQNQNNNHSVVTDGEVAYHERLQRASKLLARMAIKAVARDTI
jgi:hypothetical protein